MQREGGRKGPRTTAEKAKAVAGQFLHPTTAETHGGVNKKRTERQRERDGHLRARTNGQPGGVLGSIGDATVTHSFL